jgi:septal ring factor EnvC (AmiA/AmiB activator)
MRKKAIMPLFVASSLLILAAGPAEGSQTEQRIEQPVRQSIDTRQATQKEEEQWRLEKEKLVARYEQLQEQEKQLTDQEKALTQQIASAKTRIVAKEKQLADIEDISRQIQPFIQEIFNALKSQVADGYPFLMDERQGRLGRLETALADPDVAISEKYRKVMEALLVEAEYGFTIEAHQETITMDGQSMLADIFRLGRISLFYQSLDRKRCGFYNAADGVWQSLDTVHNPAIQTAIDIAAKRRPIELLSLPLGRMITQ